jgi:hypothetical protein
MDVLPFPHGRGFTGAKAWWNYVLGKEERRRLDHLMGVALLDEGICNRLVKERDCSLLTAFGLSEETQAWLRTITATSLVEFAQAIVAGSESAISAEAA